MSSLTYRSEPTSRPELRPILWFPETRRVNRRRLSILAVSLFVMWIANSSWALDDKIGCNAAVGEHRQKTLVTSVCFGRIAERHMITKGNMHSLSPTLSPHDAQQAAQIGAENLPVRNSIFPFRGYFDERSIGSEPAKLSCQSCGSSKPTEERPFRVFDGTLYQDKSRILANFLEPIAILYAAQLWGETEDYQEPPDTLDIMRGMQYVRENYGPSEKRFVVLDVEKWPLRRASDDVIQESVNKLVKTLQGYREVAPNHQFGFYGIAPVRNYHCALRQPTNPCYERWRDTNKRLDPVTSSVDALLPSLYTLYSDERKWVRYARVHIAQARKINQDLPVYVFLWPRYHDSNLLKKHQYVGDKFWRLQLDTAKTYADGVVIWGGWDFENRRPKKWDPAASWWRVTKDWLSEAMPK